MKLQIKLSDKLLLIMHSSVTTIRLDIVDALRGATLFGIFILHNVLHFNLYYIPENQPEWLVVLDKYVLHAVFFLLAGKAYVVFSLLFGLSFYIQLRNRNSQGYSFTWRFAWRMLLLLIIAEFNAVFYSGNILLMYAVVGLILIPFSKLSNRIVLVTIVVCLLQPLEIARIVYFFINPHADFTYLYMNYSVSLAMMNGSFIDAIKANINDGQICNMLYYIEKGRLSQTAGFFLLGMLLGRLNLFIKNQQSVYVWKKIAIYSSVVFVILFIVTKVIARSNIDASITNSLETIFVSLSNFLQAAFLIAVFVLLWFYKNNEGYYLQRVMIPYGKMSLTNYISQSIIGVFVYYGFGLGMYQYLGATLSMFVGILIFLLQLTFTKLWLKHHKQGVLECLWKKGTWILAKGK